MRSELATVTVEAGPGAFWLVDTRVVPGKEPVVNEYGPFEGRAELRVRQGRHEFQLEREGGPRGSPWAVSLLAGDSTTHHFAPPPAPSPPVIEPQLPIVAPEPGRGDDVAERSFQSDADEAFERACPLGLADPECVTTGAVDARAAMSAADAKAAHWRTAALVTGHQRSRRVDCRDGPLLR